MRTFLVSIAALLLFLGLWGALNPQSTYAVDAPPSAVQCDCNSDTDCSGDQDCDEGTSANCTPTANLTGLCGIKGGSKDGEVNKGGEKLNLTIPGSIPTPLGSIPLDPTLFAQWLLNFGVGLGLLLSILVIIIGGYGVATSAGNPENLEKAKAQITAAVSGLLFILLTGLILRTIGGIIGIDIKLFGI